ncbi:hypothetical protein JD508_06220 [Aeromonas jandaei]|uniref:hypothetical protein n=1 Tax=Aeromonas jandaei TaxID=650 RepID=UPI00191D8E69|nr:hypothetical protein [Aeromonas jandaei]MBL0609855.1 hypothetical protein [Aeromonas jandaei]
MISFKSIKWISFTLLLVYSATPFINGLGCDYQQQYERDDFSFYSTCKFGYAKSVVHDKVTGEVLKHEGFLGKRGDTVIFIANRVTRTAPHPDFHSNVYSVMHNDFLYIAKIIHKDKEDWIVMTYPYYRLQKVKTLGKQSLW